jgi:hypothetical protein
MSSQSDGVTASDTPAARTCTICGQPLDPALIEAGFTDHGEAGQLAGER